MRQSFFSDRSFLAEKAAHRQLTGQELGSVTSRLRLVTTAELLCPAPPPRTTLDLCSELEVLCASVQEMVRRRPGWLYTAFSGTAPLPMRRRLLHAAVLCVLRGALMMERPAVLLGEVHQGSVLLQLRGGHPGDAPTLLHRLARESGGMAVFSNTAPLSAVLRLPLATNRLCCDPPLIQELLSDRFSLPYLYLTGFCAEP